jgi:hypothetical protein
MVAAWRYDVHCLSQLSIMQIETGHPITCDIQVLLMPPIVLQFPFAPANHEINKTRMA